MTLASICYDECIGIRIATETEKEQTVAECAMGAYANRVIALARTMALEIAPELRVSSECLDLAVTAAIHVILETTDEAFRLAPNLVLTDRFRPEITATQSDVVTLISTALDARPDLENQLSPVISAIRTRFSPKSQKTRSR